MKRSKKEILESAIEKELLNKEEVSSLREDIEEIIKEKESKINILKKIVKNNIDSMKKLNTVIGIISRI